MEKDEEIANILRQFINCEPREVVDENVPIIKQPQYYKAELSLWTELKQCDVDLLNATTTVEELQSELAALLQLDEYTENKRQSIEMTLFTNVMLFAKERCFNDRQTSVLFAMFKQTHKLMKETPFNNLDQCLHLFTELLYCHSVRRPPFSLDIFSIAEGSMLMDFAMQNYFKHFKLYKYVFTPNVTLNLKMHYEGRPLTPLPDEIVCDLGLVDKVVEEEENKNKEGEEEREGGGKGGGVEKTPLAKDLEKEGANEEVRRIVHKYLEGELTELKRSVETRMKMVEEELLPTGEAQKAAAASAKSTKKSKSKR